MLDNLRSLCCLEIVLEPFNRMAINAKDRTKNPMPALASSLSVNTKLITRTMVKIIMKQAMEN